jgi:hypothetical protein
MRTFIDGDGSFWLQEHIRDNVIPSLDEGEKDRVEVVYEEYVQECADAVDKARTVKMLIADIDRIQRTYMRKGARMLRGKDVSILTSGTNDPNPLVLEQARMAANNGGLTVMTAEDEYTVDRFMAYVKIAKYDKVCSSLTKKNGKLTGEFDKIVSVTDKERAYSGGTLIENGLNGLGAIVKAIGMGCQVEICKGDVLLATTVNKFGLPVRYV